MSKLFSLIRAKSFILLGLYSVFIGVVETFAVGLILPFMDFIQHKSFAGISFDFANPRRVIIVLSLILAFFYGVRFFLNQAYFARLFEFSRNAYFTTGCKVFAKINKLSYSTFCKLSKPLILKILTQEAYNFSIFVQALLLGACEVIIFVLISIFLCLISLKICLIILLYLGCNGIFLFYYLRPKIASFAALREAAMGDFFKVIDLGLDSFVYFKLQNESLQGQYLKSADIYAKANVKNDYYQALPRQFLEANAFIILVLTLGYLASYNFNDLSFYLPSISVFIAALYRLLPSLNRIITCYNQINFYKNSTKIINDFLAKKEESLHSCKLCFTKGITLVDISFKRDEKFVFKDINLRLVPGDKILIKGQSGCGKTTFATLLAGLLPPSSGKILAGYDKISKNNLLSYRSHFALIGQNESLLDKDCLENVYFFRDKDEAKAKKLLNDFALNKLLNYKDTKNISLGERSRLAMCRAFYANPSIVILDEATSVIDEDTKDIVFATLKRLCKDKILIIISHSNSLHLKDFKAYWFDNHLLKLKEVQSKKELA